MSNIPLTFVLPLHGASELVRRNMLHEAAANDAKNMVLQSYHVEEIIADPAMAEVFRKEMDDEGLTFLDSHAPYGEEVDLNMPDTHKIAVLRHKLHLNIAAGMNVDTMTIHIGNDHTCVGDSCDVQIDRICCMLDELLPEAEKCGVVICIENICLPVNTPENLWRIKKRFDSPYLGFCYDSGHANNMNNGRFVHGTARDLWGKCNAGEPLWDDKILEKMMPEMICCHLHDNIGSLDLHNLPGTGNIDWDHTVKMLKQAPKLRSIQSEIISTRHRISIKKQIDCFRNLFKD